MTRQEITQRLDELDRKYLDENIRWTEAEWEEYLSLIKQEIDFWGTYEEILEEGRRV